MKSITTLFIGAGLIALQGCASADVDPSLNQEDVASNEAAVNAGSASLVITSDWGSGYCAEVKMTNGLAEATSRWQVIIDLKASVANNVWNIKFAQNTGVTTVTPANYNTSIAPGGTASFGFCANATPTSGRPSIKAWNMESNAYATCGTNSGIFPTKAALAVAMANELGRWEPLKDLAVSGGFTKLTSEGLARCTNGCKNTLGILAQQNSAATADQGVFNPISFNADLNASWDRQRNLILNLSQNNKPAVPPAHKLTYVGGPTNLGKGNCGPHYIYQVDTDTGVPLTSAQASAMANTMCYFGYGSCGANPYIAFAQVTNGCPSGKTCIAIDPTDGDNSSTSTTTAGSAPSYPMNRVWDPANTLLGTACITTRDKLGTMVAKCSTLPETCGYLYCVAN